MGDAATMNDSALDPPVCELRPWQAEAAEASAVHERRASGRRATEECSGGGMRESSGGSLARLGFDLGTRWERRKARREGSRDRLFG